MIFVLNNDYIAFYKFDVNNCQLWFSTGKLFARVIILINNGVDIWSKYGIMSLVRPQGFEPEASAL